MLTMLPEKSRDQLIRDEFAAVGGSMTTAGFAQHCLDAGLWPDDVVERFVLRAAQAEVRKALKHRDSAGLPFAGETDERDEDGARVWRQRSMWRLQDYAANVGDLELQAESCQAMARLLEVECIERYGISPYFVIGPATGETDAAD